MLCAASAWTACNGWRATFGRWVEVRQGRKLGLGIGELWAVGIATAIALACLAVLLYLVARASGEPR